MTHFEYVAWSYGIVATGILGLVFYVWFNLRRQSRVLADLEKKGLSRRRPAREVAEQ